MRYIASCSFGKDSLAMVLRLIEEHKPLDEVVFYDTGMEFNAIYENLSKLRYILYSLNIEFVHLEPEVPFLDKMFNILVRNRDGSGFHRGYSWCGGVCRWGTTDKLKSLDKYCETEPTMVYVGIAADEQPRIDKERKPYKLFPLVDWGMTEADCLAYCRERNWNWDEETSATKSGYVDLYYILDRVSCYCCCNKNKKELRNIYHFLPLYWEKLKYLQEKNNRPMKNFHNRKYGDYGNVFALEKVFEREVQNDNSR